MGSDLTPPPYQRWINNPPGWGVGEPLSRGPFGLDSNGAWMESGDYERAFRGFPSPKTINIFAGGFAQAPSTKSIIFGGLANFGVKALGLWFLSKLARPAQTATTVQQKFPFSDYFSNLNLKFNWGSTGTTGGGTTGTTSTRSTETDPDKGKKDKVDNNDNDNDTVDDPNKDKKSGGAEGANPINGNDNDPQSVQKAKATNTKHNQIAITGEVVKTSDELNNDGYPKEFQIHDSTTTGNKEKPNKYFFEYVKEINGKPIYKCVKAEVISSADESAIKGTQVSYTVYDGIEKGKGITSNITQMPAIDGTSGSLVHYDKLERYEEGKYKVGEEYKTIKFP